jgi:methylated-DNA-[protein]-cysteine S-methyltransferase
MALYFFKYFSPIGNVYCVFAGPFLVELAILERPLNAAGLSESAPPLNNSFKSELDAYFAGRQKLFRQKIKFIEGTAFEHKVWRALSGIPYGETRSYRWISERAGSPKAMRAAGQALKNNPLPIILPCHRIIASDGSPGGYSAGVAVKQWLLRHEKKVTAGLV